MRKKGICLFIMAILIFLTACDGFTTEMSLVFSISNQERIKVTLDTTGGYKLTTDGNSSISISIDEEEIINGTFLMDGYFESYVESAQNDADITVLELTEHSCTYQFMDTGDMIIRKVFQIENAETDAIFQSLLSQEEFKEIMGRLILQKIG